MKFSTIISLLFIVSMINSTVSAKNFVKKVKNAKGIEVTYQTSYKGKVRPGNLLMTVSGDKLVLSVLAPEKKTQKQNEDDFKIPETKNYVDYSVLKSFQWAELPNGKIISSETPFVFGEGKHLGLNCKILRTSIKSNTIEVWYTNDIPFRGTPQANVGVPDGLVLKTVRNGDSVMEAVDIKAVKEEQNILPSSWGEVMDSYDFQYTINQSGVITIPVFDQQTICFNGAKLGESLQSGIVYEAAGGTVILKKVKLPESVRNRSVFAEVVQYSQGDAYDRTGSIFMIPEKKELSFLNALRDLNTVPAFTSGDKKYPALISTDKYEVPVEQMRFFTGFGVRYFNYQKVKGQDWVDSVLYKTEVTYLAENLKGEVWIGAYIGNWDSKGHRLSLKLKYYPDEPRKIYKT